MNGKIYVLTNGKTNMKYIGQTFQEVGVRINQGYDSTTEIGKAIHTYGLRNFIYQTLKTGITTQNNLDEWENHYIEAYGTRYPNGYNESGA